MEGRRGRQSYARRTTAGRGSRSRPKGSKPGQRAKTLIQPNLPRRPTGTDDRCGPSADDRCKPSVDDRFCGPSADDRFCKPSVDDRICGPSVDDRICGPSVDDRICGPSVDDRICGPSVDDRICGPSVDDRICGPSVDDRICGPSVDDRCGPSVDDRFCEPSVDDRCGPSTDALDAIRMQTTSGPSACKRPFSHTSINGCPRTTIGHAVWLSFPREPSPPPPAVPTTISWRTRSSSQSELKALTWHIVVGGATKQFIGGLGRQIRQN